MGERLSNFVVRLRSLTSLSLPLAKFKVPSSGWRRGLISIARLEGWWEGGREWSRSEGREEEEGSHFTIALFSASPPFQPSPPPPSWFIPRWEADTLRRDTLQPLEPRTLERKVFSTPSSPRRRRENGDQRWWRVGEDDAIALHWVRVITPSKASRWPRRQRPESIRTLLPPPVCRVWHGGVQCTVRFSTFIIRCARAPAEGTRRCCPSWKGWYRVNRWSTIFSIRFDRSGCSIIGEIQYWICC